MVLSCSVRLHCSHWSRKNHKWERPEGQIHTPHCCDCHALCHAHHHGVHRGIRNCSLPCQNGGTWEQGTLNDVFHRTKDFRRDGVGASLTIEHCLTFKVEKTLLLLRVW